MTKAKKRARGRAPAITNAQMGEALGVDERQVQRLKAKGMPTPAAGEALEQWRDRALAWRREKDAAATRQGPLSQQGDPNNPQSIAYWTRAHRAARAQLAAMQVKEQEGRLHDVPTCERERVDAVLALRQTIDVVIVEVARRFATKERPEAVLVEEQRRLYRNAFEDLRQRMRVREDASVHGGDARGPAVPGPDGAERLGGPAPRP